MSTGGTKHKASDNEDEFFYQQSQQLMEEQRKTLDAERSEQERIAQQQAHWMKCPKCGQDMTEINLSGVMVDQCGGCKGIFFDAGEIDMLIKSQRPAHVIERLQNLFK